MRARYDTKLLIAQIERTLPTLAQARRLLDDFTDMVRNGDDASMAGWLEQAKASQMAAFAGGLTAELKAVVAALPEPWSNGQAEGQINRLKMLKRQMCCAAGIDLLRAPPAPSMTHHRN